MFPCPFFDFRSLWNKKESQNDIENPKLIKLLINTVMSVEKRDQQNDLAFSDRFTLQNIYKFLLFYVPLKFPSFVADFWRRFLERVSLALCWNVRQLHCHHWHAGRIRTVGHFTAGFVWIQSAASASNERSHTCSGQ